MRTFWQYLETTTTLEEYITQVKKLLRSLGLSREWQPHKKEISLYFYQGIPTTKAARMLNKKYSAMIS